MKFTIVAKQMTISLFLLTVMVGCGKEEKQTPAQINEALKNFPGGSQTLPSGKIPGSSGEDFDPRGGIKNLPNFDLPKTERDFFPRGTMPNFPGGSGLPNFPQAPDLPSFSGGLPGPRGF